MSEYFFIKFINFMLKSKSLLEYTNSFSPNKYKKNDKIKIFSIEPKYFKIMKMYCNVCNKYRKFTNPKISYIFLKKY